MSKPQLNPALSAEDRATIEAHPQWAALIQAYETFTSVQEEVNAAMAEDSAATAAYFDLHGALTKALNTSPTVRARKVWLDQNHQAYARREGNRAAARLIATLRGSEYVPHPDDAEYERVLDEQRASAAAIEAAIPDGRGAAQVRVKAALRAITAAEKEYKALHAVFICVLK